MRQGVFEKQPLAGPREVPFGEPRLRLRHVRKSVQIVGGFADAQEDPSGRVQVQLHGMRCEVQATWGVGRARDRPHGREGACVSLRQVLPSSLPTNRPFEDSRIEDREHRVVSLTGRLCCRSSSTFASPQPPRYSDSTDTKRLGKRCEYCHVEVSTAGYTDHLISSHSELLFHCSQCNMYLDRKEFALHASAHDAFYAGNGEKEANRRTKKPRKWKNSRDRNDNPVSGSKSKTFLSVQIIERTIRRGARDGSTVSDVAEENEFSDHSDVEYFGRLPESVFQAIEDTQDSQCNSDDPGSPNVPECVSEHTTQADKNTESSSGIAAAKHRKPRTCPICSKVYTASSSYFYHLNSHRQSEHVCSVCGKRLGNKASLVQHAALHSSERRFECAECGKKFRSRASLYIHSESHRATKSFACDQCTSSFRWRTHLLRHLKRHSTEKAHVCTNCGRGFSVRCDLLRHLRTHRAGSHTCEKCNAKFAQRRYLKVHMMKKHSIAISGSEVKSQ